jgi:hypothetical protein
MIIMMSHSRTSPNRSYYIHGDLCNCLWHKVRIFGFDLFVLLSCIAILPLMTHWTNSTCSMKEEDELAKMKGIDDDDPSLSAFRSLSTKAGKALRPCFVSRPSGAQENQVEFGRSPLMHSGMLCGFRFVSTLYVSRFAGWLDNACVNQFNRGPIYT